MTNQGPSSVTGKRKTAALRCKILFQLPADMVVEFKQVITAMSRCKDIQIMDGGISGRAFHTFHTSKTIWMTRPYLLPAIQLWAGHWVARRKLHSDLGAMCIHVIKRTCSQVWKEHSLSRYVWNPICVDFIPISSWSSLSSPMSPSSAYVFSEPQGAIWAASLYNVWCTIAMCFMLKNRQKHSKTILASYLHSMCFAYCHYIDYRHL